MDQAPQLLLMATAMSDRSGRRPMVLACLTLIATGMIGSGLAHDMTTLVARGSLAALAERLGADAQPG